MERWDEVTDRLRGREPAVFLDYDGTMTPIVDDPAAATIPPETADAVRRLAQSCMVAVVSGRDLGDVRSMVGIDGMYYAGSHGFDILTDKGESRQVGTEYLPALDAAEEELGSRLGEVPGAHLERKRFAIAIHYRGVPEDEEGKVETIAHDVAERHDDLRLTGGKKIYELRPDLDWDKGRALVFLLEELGLDRDDVIPAYVGDDVTDEDAFRALRRRGLGIVVRGEDDDRATAADYALRDTEETRILLERLAGYLEGR